MVELRLGWLGSFYASPLKIGSVCSIPKAPDVDLWRRLFSVIGASISGSSLYNLCALLKFVWALLCNLRRTNGSLYFLAEFCFEPITLSAALRNDELIDLSDSPTWTTWSSWMTWSSWATCSSWLSSGTMPTPCKKSSEYSTDWLL